MKFRILIFAGVCGAAVCALAGQDGKGFPGRDAGDGTLLEHFQTPPKGYGTVPFYWWDGDSLDRERLADQLEILADAPVDGFSVSYIHSHPGIDRELNAAGYGGFGKPDPGRPEAFSKGWWDVWNWFAGECADREIGLGLDDYVIGWEKNGYYVDEVLADGDMRKYRGRLSMEKHQLAPGELFRMIPDSAVVSVTVFPSGKSLSFIPGREVKCKAGKKGEETVYVITATPSHELHPKFGQRLCDAYFGRFEEKLDARARQSLNYFFQDELHYNLNMRSWAEDMPQEFQKRKGYDVRPFLPALFENVGDVTPKIRLDYADVLTQLAEERYFKPIFDWHDSRGLIYGCDNNGRGLEPLQYLDYFRMTSWFTAPGNDAPARGSSFRQTKVSSSISHLYSRPRTWLEAFHSMGWDSNGEWLTSQLDHHMIAGGNLLCLHGLYYSTHGGWWEWAPPSFFFRMPYWPHMKHWLRYGERLSYLLSQGAHVCDIAVLYPTESMQAYGAANHDVMWHVTDLLTKRGLDYDFIDFHSLKKAIVSDGELAVGGERYKVLVLPDVKAMHFSTLQKIEEFCRAGGIVISTGDTLLATTRAGENDSKASAIWKGMFSSGFGRCRIVSPDSVPNVVEALITPDFMTGSRKGYVLHRRIGDHDVYMVMNVEKGDEMFFRSHGKVEIWDAHDGSAEEQPVLRQENGGTWIRFDGEPRVSYLYVFSPGTPTYGSSERAVERNVTSVTVDGDWEMEIIPTMRNRWGDYRLPACDEIIGPEAREFGCHIIGASSEICQAVTGHYGYGPLMELAVADASVSLDSLLASPQRLDACAWEPYQFSWQYGVKDSPGSQGYHGLKGKIDNRFLILDRGGHQIFRTYVYAPSDGMYVVQTEGVTPYRTIVDGKPVDIGSALRLAEGWHSLVIAYADTKKEDYRLEDKTSYCWDDRQRSAVVFLPAGHRALKDNDPYGHTIAMKWYDSDRLAYSPVRGEGIWEYNFQTAPATRMMDFRVNGEILTAMIDGKKVHPGALKRLGEGHYTLSADDSDGKIHEVTVTAVPTRGYDGAAFFAEPVRLTCGIGRMPAGDWTCMGALKYYSGGIKYRKTMNIDLTSGARVELDLGTVDATCEISVNGHAVDILMNTPYRIDITDFVTSGDNVIEVLVYSTLSNHYQSIPSAYRGIPRAGLIGPVALRTYVTSR